MKVTAIILAAGKGTRMKGESNKVFLKLKRPILAHTILSFEKNDNVNEIIIVGNANEINIIEKLVNENKLGKVTKIVEGGSTRQESCYNGVYACEECDIIIIHDGARPFIRQDTINESIKDANEYGVSVVGVPVKDTIKVIDANGFVKETLDRNKLWAVQTPQTFKAEIIRKAHEKALEDKFEGTDDTSLAERIGYNIKFTKGHYDNIKITTPDDLFIAEKILNENKDEFN